MQQLTSNYKLTSISLNQDDHFVSTNDQTEDLVNSLNNHIKNAHTSALS